MSNLNVYTVEFAPVWPVGCCLVILAKDRAEATAIAAKTIRHTKEFTVTKHPDKPGVVVYKSGDY